MEQNYCIVKAGGLQEAVRKKEGTLLLRKKKIFYQSEQWVTFCVHNGKIPLLEWYDSEESSTKHVPDRVHDLLYCMFVSQVFSDDRGFIIGFSDEKNTTIEFCASDSAECAEWISSLTNKLRDLNCLGDSENIYTSFNQLGDSATNSPSQSLITSPTSPVSDPDELETSPRAVGRTFDSQPHFQRNPPPLSPPPPLPLRPYNSLTRTRTLLTDEIPMQAATTSRRDNSVIANEYISNSEMQKQSESSRVERNNYDSLGGVCARTLIGGEFASRREQIAVVNDALRQMSCSASLSSSSLPRGEQPRNSPILHEGVGGDAPSSFSPTPIASSPLRIISRRILQQQHLHRHHHVGGLQLDGQAPSIMNADGEELGESGGVLPPLPPRKTPQTRLSGDLGNVVYQPYFGADDSTSGKQDEKEELLATNAKLHDEILTSAGTANEKKKINAEYDVFDFSSSQQQSSTSEVNYDVFSARSDAKLGSEGVITGNYHEARPASSSQFCPEQMPAPSRATFSSSSDETSFSSCRMRMSGVSSLSSGGGGGESSRASTSSEPPSQFHSYNNNNKHYSVVGGNGDGTLIEAVNTESAHQSTDSGIGSAATAAHHNSVLRWRPKREQYDFTSSPPLTIPTSFPSAFREALNKPRTIPLLLTTCVEHIAFVEVGGKVWIGGWTRETNALLRKHSINFGDEVVQVGNEPIRGISQVPAIFYNQSTPGVPIEIKICAIPYGSVYSLTKPLNPKRSLGIVLHNKKNRIASIEEKSPAWNAQIPAKLTPYVYKGAAVKEVPAVITAVDGQPLNPFAKDEQFYRRVNAIPFGASFNVIVHPLDLVKSIKTQLKTNKFHKKFLHVN